VPLQTILVKQLTPIKLRAMPTKKQEVDVPGANAVLFPVPVGQFLTAKNFHRVGLKTSFLTQNIAAIDTY